MKTTARLALDALIVLAGAALLLAVAGQGIDVDIGALRVRVHDVLRTAGTLAALIAIRAGLSIRAPRADGSTGAAAAWLAIRALLAVIVAAVGMYHAHHVRTAGGLDSYGYVSAAALIASGQLTEPQPLAANLPFVDAIDAATPIGHVPRPDGRSSAPRFPLGLPLAMAVFSLAGAGAVYYVPLVLAIGALALTWRLSADLSSGALGGAIAAALLAVDPLFAAYAIQPMSDVPATFWVIGSVLLLTTGAHPVLVAVPAAMGVLTRPALLPAAAVAILLSGVRRRRRGVVTAAFCVAAIAGAQAVLNVWLYGGATMSGYGTASHMFELSPSRLAANTANFGKWLTYSQTPVFWLLWPAAVWVLRRDRRTWEISATAAAAAAPYLFYLVFDDWESSRFVLPSIALVLVLAGAAAATLASGLTARARPAAVLAAAAAVIAAAGASHRFLAREGIYNLATLEAKYALTGEWFRTNTSERAVVLAGLHSGSIRLYGGRPTIRWDRIPETALDETVRGLSNAGWEPYLALDLPSEPPLFEERFRHAATSIEQVSRVRVVNIYRFVSAR